MPGLSERQYAARVGLSRGAVQKAKETGRLVQHADGSIDAAACLMKIPAFVRNKSHRSAF